MKIICHTHQLVNPPPQLTSAQETHEHFHFSICDPDGCLDFRRLVFHVAGALIHLLLIVAVISLILHFVRGTPVPDRHIK